MASLRLALCVAAPALTAAQFGGAYEPPAPVCEPFRCSEGMTPVGNSEHKIWSFGCKDSGMNFMSVGGFDPNDPLGGLKKGKNVNKCCIERSICQQTCGSTSQQCHNEFQACTKKLCKGDQNCALSAMMSSFQADPPEEEEEARKKTEGKLPENYDYEKERKERECRGYVNRQKEGCKCVPSADWQAETNSNLKAFYKTHNPEKLDANGEIKDLEEVWKKWKGKETEMFKALTKKYKDKAVEMKIRPTPPPPPPYTPPPPLSKEEQEKEDKRMADQRARWKREDEQREQERLEREERRREEEEEATRRKRDEEDGETVEL